MLVPAYGTSWPAAGADRIRADRLHGRLRATAATVPEDITAAILLILGDLYTFREDSISGTIINAIPRRHKTAWYPMS